MHDPVMIQNPIADVLLYNVGAEGYIDPYQQGFAYHDWLYMSWPVYMQLGNVQADPLILNKSYLYHVKEIDKVVCTPYKIPTMSLTPSSFTVDDTTAWEGIEDLKYNTFVHSCTDASGAGHWITTNFKVPWFGAWSVDIKRTYPKQDNEATTVPTQQAFTYIAWDAYVLVIPFDAPMALFKYINGYYYKVADVNLSSFGGQMNEEGSDFITINYWNLDGKILLSGDNYATNFVYQENDYIWVPPHNVTVGCFGHTLDMWIYPTQFPTGAFVSTNIGFHYPPTRGSVEYEGIGIAPSGSSAVITTENSGYYGGTPFIQYRCTLNPGPYDDATGLFNYTPELEGVQVRHWPVVYTSLTRYYNLAHPRWGERVMSISGDEGIDFDGNSWVVTLDNHDGALSDPTNVLFLRPYRVVHIRGGYRWTDGTYTFVPQFSGVITSPIFTASSDRKHIATVRIASLSWLCQQVKNKGDWPMFDSWKIRDALTWLAARCRVHSSRLLFYGSTITSPYPATWGVDQRLSRGTPTEPKWKGSILQTSAWEMMKKIADYIQYDLFFDRIGRLVCQPKFLYWDGDLTDITFNFHCQETSVYNYQDATDVELTYQGEEWFNAVYVGSFLRSGGAISAYRVNWPSVTNPNSYFYMGFEKAMAFVAEAYVDPWKIAELADILYIQSLLFPRTVSFTTWYNPNISPGALFSMSGSRHKVVGTDASPRYYRVVNMSHNITLQGLSTTQVIGELIGPYASP